MEVIAFLQFNQFLIGQTLADGRAEQPVKAGNRLVLHVTSPKGEGELANVAVQVLRQGVMEAVQPALVQREHILDAILGHVAADVIAKAMIGRLVPVEQPVKAVFKRRFRRCGWSSRPERRDAPNRLRPGPCRWREPRLSPRDFDARALPKWQSCRCRQGQG